MKKSWVKTDDGWVNAKTVKFIDISEGLHGDEMTFEYKGKEFVSLICISHSQPG